MSIEDIKPTTPLRHYVGNEQEQGRQKSGYGGFQGQQNFRRHKDRGPTNDETSFMGIPQEQLTEPVTAAITSLMEEIDGLRDQLHRVQSLENLLEDTMDQHFELPVLTHHALLREVSLMAGQVAQNHIKSTFAYFQVKNFAAIKQKSGLLAGEAVIKESAEIIKQNLREIDHIGTLGGDGFGIVFALCDETSTIKKMKLLSEKVIQGPIIWDGHHLEIDIAFGIYPIHGDEDVECIVQGMDTDLHRRFY